MSAVEMWSKDRDARADNEMRNRGLSMDSEEKNELKYINLHYSVNRKRLKRERL
ncbi:MAG: hypothetical protein ACP5U0_08180 [Caldisphaera sp.]